MTNWPAGNPGSPLSDAQFAAALRRGMGRAVLQAKRGLSEAQLAELRRWYANTPAHDAQIEDERAPQIHEIARMAGDLGALREVVQTALTSDVEYEWHPALHLCELAGLLAEQGDDEATEALARFLARDAARGRYLGGFDLVAAKGFDGLIRFATILGGDLPEDEHWRTISMIESLAETAVEQNPQLNQEQEELRIRGELEAAAATNPRINAFVRGYHAWLTEIKKPRVSTDPVAGPLFTDLLRLGKELGVPAMRRAAFRWRQAASPEEIIAAATYLEQCRDNQTFRALLRSFSGDYAEWPLPLDPLLARAADPGDPCRTWVQTVLEAQTDPRVGELARRLIQAEPVSRDALDMLRLHATPEDAALIERALGRRAWKDADDLHEVALALTSFGANSDDPAWNGLLRWHYEMTPCSFCRARSFKLLVERGAADADLRAEAHHDADDGTRELAQSSAE
jgi:hypothetical protein